MPIEFNAAALNAFRNAQFQNENTVANLDGKELKAGGRHHTYRHDQTRRVPL